MERWACASGQPKLVELVLKPLALGSGPTRIFTFFDAHLVHFTKNYSEKKNPPVEMHLKITAGGVRDSFSKSEYSAPWRETFEKPGVVVSQCTTEQECVDSGTGDAVRQEELDAEGLDIQAGIAWLDSIAVTKEDLDKNPYSYKVSYKNDTTVATRTAITEQGEETLDCSELVCRYLQKIGWSKEVKWLNTKGLYYYANKFPDHLERHDALDYRPKIGDIFLWKRESGMGHTGIVVGYNEITDAVITIESISENEYTSRTYRGENSGHEGYNFRGVIKWKWNKRDGRHLLGHKSGICRFYTPKFKENDKK